MKVVQNERLLDSMVSFVLDWCLTSVNKAPDIAQTEILTILQYLIVHHGNICRQVSILYHCLKLYFGPENQKDPSLDLVVSY